MRVFLKKFVLFLLPLFLLFVVLEIRLNQIPTYLSQKKEYLEAQLEEIEIISTGLSYGDSINPQYLDRKGFNLFNDAEDLYYDVKVIEKYLARMPRLKLVILPISYFSLEYRLDRGPWAWRAPFYQFVFNIPPQDPISLFNPSFYSYTAAYGWREVLNYIKSSFASNITNQMHRDGWREVGTKAISDSPESVRAGKQSIEYIETLLMDFKTGEKNLQLVSDFIETCQSRNIHIILITPPVSHYYYDNINPKKYQAMQEDINQLVEKYNLTYHNYLKDPRFATADFYSIDHVNDLGAEKFSRILNEVINDYLKG
jgi:hypothetical protein